MFLVQPCQGFVVVHCKEGKLPISYSFIFDEEEEFLNSMHLQWQHMCSELEVQSTSLHVALKKAISLEKG